MSIRVLPAEVINQISAGEVVERPASAVKEVVENALDALATDITVEVHGGGLELIRVTDNGHGMNREDLTACVLRHATSKLSSMNDLFSLTTLGFRGEALPSIAAVSDLSIKSRCTESGHGHHLVSRAGEHEPILAIGMPQGTIVEIRHLFAYTPARLKFMKSPAAESQRIVQNMERLALSHPGVRFTLLLDGRIVLQTAGNNSLVETAAAIFGTSNAKHLWAFSGAKGRHLTCSGVLARPQLTRNNRTWQYFFLNGRAIEHRGLAFALDDAYRTLLPSKRFPVAIIHMTIDPAVVDVNVHPAKTEVRFSDERAVIAEAITQFRVQVAAMLKPSPVNPDASFWRELPVLFIDSSEQPVAYVSPTGVTVPPPAAPVLFVPTPSYRLVGQVMDSYLLIEKQSRLTIVDQHAAHERILFEELLQRDKREIQELAIPVPVDLGASAHLVAAHHAELVTLGLTLEHFGGSTYLVRSLPAVYRGYFDEQTLRELLTDISEDRLTQDPRERLAQALACRAAIKARTRLSPAEMVELLDRLYAVDRAVACPHGRPVEIEFTETELFRLFHPSVR